MVFVVFSLMIIMKRVEEEVDEVRQKKVYRMKAIGYIM